MLDYSTPSGNMLFRMLTTRCEIEHYYRTIHPLISEEMIEKLALEEILSRIVAAKKLRDWEILQASESFAF
jgi:hypothetical protein